MKPLQAVSVKLSEVGSTHMTPAENYYSQEQVDKLTTAILSVEADNARLREALNLECGNRCNAEYNPCNARKALAIESSSTALQEYRDSVLEKCASMIAEASMGFCGSNVEICMQSVAKSIRELKHD